MMHAAGMPSPRALAVWRLHAGARAARLVMLAGAVALHLALFLLVFPNSPQGPVLHGFLTLTYQDGGQVLAGAVPYKDFLLEYPPGTLAFMVLPNLFATGYLSFRMLFFAEIAALDAVVVVCLYAIARGARVPAWRAIVLYTVAIVTLGPLAGYRLDLAPAALMALALLAWQRDRPALAAAVLAVGTATKLYPLLLLPPLMMDQWVRGRPRRALAAVVVFGVILAAALIPALPAGSQGLSHAFSFQADRNLQIESIWAMPPLLLHFITGYALQIADLDRAFVVLGPGNAFGMAGTLALVLASLLTYWCWWRLRARPELRPATLLLGTCLLVLAAATLTKVLSPQYLLWVIPLLALLPVRPAALSAHVTDGQSGGSIRVGPPRAFSALTLLALCAFEAALVLTQWIYPLHYGDLVVLLLPTAVAVLVVRNALLVVVVAALLVAFWRLGTNGQMPRS